MGYMPFFNDFSWDSYLLIKSLQAYKHYNYAVSVWKMSNGASGISRANNLESRSIGFFFKIRECPWNLLNIYSLLWTMSLRGLLGIKMTLIWYYAISFSNDQILHHWHFYLLMTKIAEFLKQNSTVNKQYNSTVNKQYNSTVNKQHNSTVNKQYNLHGNHPILLRFNFSHII